MVRMAATFPHSFIRDNPDLPSGCHEWPRAAYGVEMSHPLDRLRELRRAALLRRAQRGDEAAFRGLFRDLHPIVQAYVARRVASTADVEDLVARVFEKLVVHLGEVEPARGGPKAFVLGVARNAVIDHLRRLRPTVG